MQRTLKGKKIAILSADGFEQSELMEPRQALLDAGADVHIVSIHPGEIKGWNEGNWARAIKVDKLVSQVSADEYDGLYVPGGVINPDRLRMDENAIEFTEDFIRAGKPVAAMCHGPQILIETGLLGGRTVTSWRSLKTDLQNAGANWVDEEVVVDQGLVTARKPGDIPAFKKRMIEVFAAGVPDIHPAQELHH